MGCASALVSTALRLPAPMRSRPYPRFVRRAVCPRCGVVKPPNLVGELHVAIPEGRRTRYEIADTRIRHALDDLLGLVLAVDPAACPAAADKDCC